MEWVIDVMVLIKLPRAFSNCSSDGLRVVPSVLAQSDLKSHTVR